MKITLIILGIGFAAVVVFLAIRRPWDSTAIPVRGFVSMTCEKGDITLTLDADHRFSLSLKHWDPKTNTHTGEDRLAGQWREDGDILLLKAQENQLTYKRETTTFIIGTRTATVAGYAWVASTKMTPFDSYPLVEKERTDAALLEAAKK